MGDGVTGGLGHHGREGLVCMCGVVLKVLVGLVGGIEEDIRREREGQSEIRRRERESQSLRKS